MIRQPIRMRTAIILGVASFCLLIILYSWLSYRQHLINPDDRTVPNLSQLVEACKTILTKNAAGEIWLWDDMCATYSRLILGVLLGVLSSLILGIAMAAYTPIGAFCSPPVSFFAKIPPIAMLVIYFILLGTETKMFVTMIAFAVFFTLAQAIYQAATKDVTDHAIYKGYSLGASSIEVIWEIVYKQILPRVVENVRLQIGPAMITLIAAEWLTADVGFGYRPRLQGRIFHFDVVFTYLIVLGATGLLIDWLLVLMRRRLCPWFGA